MSIRTIIEINHDHINQPVDRGHISEELRDAIFGNDRDLMDEFGSMFAPLQGIRRLTQRHHSDEITLKVK